MVTDLKPALKLLCILVYLFLLGWLSTGDTGDLDAVLAFGRPFLYIAQFIGVVLIFLLVPGLFTLFFTKDRLRYTKLHIPPNFTVLVLGALTFIMAIPFIAWMEEVNKQMTLPASMAGLEHWMQESEAKAGKIAEFLLTGTGVKNLLVNLFVIAFTAALTEEFFFRGILQRILREVTKNYHIAVWISAILFSAYHMQFYGFIPRMLMGAVLGYLFVWSGSLWVSIFAHFTNNAFAVVVSWLSQRGAVPKEMTNGPFEVSATAGLISLAIVCILLYFVYQRRKKEGEEVPVVMAQDGPIDKFN